MPETTGRSDHWFIIIRGVPGVGKSTIAELLLTMLPGSVVDLNLDDKPPKFPGFGTAFKSRFVVGHLYSGSDRTAYPKGWVDDFRRRGFLILSVVLDMDLEPGWQRIANDPARKNNSYWSRENYERLYRRFYNEQKFVEFDKSAKIDDTIRIKADGNPGDIAKEILQTMRIRGAEV